MPPPIIITGDADKEAALLLNRLKSQFGDLDITNLVNNGEESKKTKKKTKKKDSDSDSNSDSNSLSDSSDESSCLPEPSPEELLAWQEAQFQKGQQTLEWKERLKMVPIQRRRRDLQQRYNNEDDGDEDDEDAEWEQIAAAPDLQGQVSSFFPSTSSSTSNSGNGNSSGNNNFEGVEFLGGVHPLLQQLCDNAGGDAGDSEILSTQWLRLYSAGAGAGDGLSFHNLLQRIQGYPGPTVLLLETIPSPSKSLKTTSTSSSTSTSTSTSSSNKSSKLGFYTTNAWKESTDYYGTNDCFLFTIDEEQDKIHFIRPKKQPTTAKGHQHQQHKHQQHKKNTGFMYCHPSTLQRTNRAINNKKNNKGRTGTTTNGAVHGIGIGGTPQQPRLHLTETLEECRAMDIIMDDGFDTTSTSTTTSTTTSSTTTGPTTTTATTTDLLLGTGVDSLNYFDVVDMEVWAVGGDDWIQSSLRDLKKQRELQQAQKSRAAKVDKKAFVGDVRLLAKHNHAMFDHMQHTAGRCDL